ncbi:MAG: TIGR03560 family F420-dependent LLM class oxidoreductase [Anaerolineales bacterium]
MLEVAIMLEGQDGLNWPRWQRIVEAVEALGFQGLFRSDHFTNANPPDKDSLELWVSLTWLADHTERIEFGPLVTPASFRHPAITARMAAAVDDLSAGRLVLGLGAGWQEREHEMFGFDLLGLEERFQRYEEYLEVVSRLLQSDERVSFEGDFYELHDALLLPRPTRPGGPPILVGGNGPQRTLPLAARFADEWNGVYLRPEDFAWRNERLDGLLEAEGRDLSEVRRSLMVGLIFGQDEAEVQGQLSKKGRTAEEMRRSGLVVGTADEVVEQLGHYAEAGVERIMLQWLALDDIEGLEALARGVLPQI